MKQHISEQQFHELSNESKSRLWDWAKKTDHQYLCSLERESTNLLFSIGQMIEFLIESDFDKDLVSGSQLIRNYTWFDSTNNLCDQLWEAVKEVLKED